MFRKQTNYLYLIPFIILLSSCSRKTYNPPSQLTVVDDELMMVGPVQYQDILDNFPEWKNAHEEAQVDQRIISEFKNIKTEINIQCFIGTWCSDSREGVPPFMKVLLLANNPNIQIELIGVDRRKDDPDHLAHQNNINRVPTLIVKMDDTEIFRMIEFPEITFEEDFINKLVNR